MNYILVVAIASFLVSSSNAEDPWTPSPLCPYPSENLTRFPYEGDCSKYWECYEGARYPMDCASGLEFNAETSKCDDPASANCDPDATIIYPTFPHSTEPTQSTLSTLDPGPVPECPYPSEDLTFYPVANNCSQYWECYQGNRYLMSCPSGLYWNTLANYCDYPENVDCSLNNQTTTTAKPTTTTPGNGTTLPTTTDDSTTTWTADPLCPYPSHEITFFPHPSNCSEYYECYEGNKYLMSCPSGLYWNDLADICDYEENVNCNRTTTTPALTTNSTASPNITTGEPETTTTPTTTTNVTTASTTTTTDNAICSGQPDGTYLSHPYDCSKFYECISGKPKEEQCPGDLLWNETLLTCDYASNVVCPNTTTTTTAAAPSAGDIFRAVVAASLLVTFTHGEDSWTPSPLCPYPSDVYTRFPYEGNCSKYWECYDGVRYTMYCPEGLEFNAELSRCDDPTEANCDPDVTIIYPTFPHSPVPTEVTTPDPGPPPECPFPSDELTFFPAINNCSQYWECFQGNGYLMTCPSGFNWNTIYNYCDYPENVDCSRNNQTATTTTNEPTVTTPEEETTASTTTVSPTITTTLPDTTTTEETTSTSTTAEPETTNTTTPTTTTNATTASTTTTTDNAICSGQPDGTYLSHPYDCSKFYECVSGKPKEQQCPGDLLWNETILTCDYAGNVVCPNTTTTTTAAAPSAGGHYFNFFRIFNW